MKRLSLPCPMRFPLPRALAGSPPHRPPGMHWSRGDICNPARRFSFSAATHIGATVFGVASNEEKLEAVHRAGADHLLDPADKDLAAKVKALTGGKGVDVVYDPVGGDLAITATRAIGWDGRYLIVGFASGVVPSFPANHVMIKTYSLIGVRAGEGPRRDPELAKRQTAALRKLAQKGVMRPHISHRFSLADAAQALAVLERREAIGRVVVAMETSS